MIEDEKMQENENVPLEGEVIVPETPEWRDEHLSMSWKTASSVIQ